MISLIIYFLLCVVLILWIIRSCSKPPNFPPGPPNIPALGGLMFVLGNSKSPSKFHGVKELVKSYGKVSGFYIGSQPFVLISDLEVLRHVLNSNKCSMRPMEAFPFNNLRALEGNLLAGSESWKETRAILKDPLENLKFLSLTSVESKLLRDFDRMFKELAVTSTDLPLDSHSFANLLFTRNAWMLLFGQRLDLNDEKFIKIADNIDQLDEHHDLKNVSAYILPKFFLKANFFKRTSIYQNEQQPSFDLQKIIVEKITEFARKEIAEDPDTMCILDFILKQNHFDIKTLEGANTAVNIILDLILKSIKPLAETLSWMILYLLCHPEMQEIIADEIKDSANLDRKKMNFTNAFIAETLRKSGPLFLALPHQSSEEIKIKDYNIPANTIVLTNIHFMMNDPEHWKDPEVFNPKRFIDANGKFRNPARMIPYSLGPRKCPGQRLADQQLFLALTSMMKQFAVYNPQGQKLPKTCDKASDPKGNIRIAPKFEFVFEKRNDC